MMPKRRQSVAPEDPRYGQGPQDGGAAVPHDHPIGTKRLILDTDYYETYNRDAARRLDRGLRPILA